MRISDWSSDVCSSDLQLFEKDIAFILRFRHVEEYLDRPDDNVSRATRAALSTLNYRLRTPTDITLHLRNAAVAIDHLPADAQIVWPLTRGALFASDRLRERVGAYVDWKRTRLNFRHYCATHMPCSG